MENNTKANMKYDEHFGWSEIDQERAKEFLKLAGPKILLAPDYYLSDAIEELDAMSIPSTLKLVTAHGLGAGNERAKVLMKRIRKEMEE